MGCALSRLRYFVLFCFCLNVCCVLLTYVDDALDSSKNNDDVQFSCPEEMMEMFSKKEGC